MLALYHLFSGTAPGELAGLDEVLREADAAELATARRVVLVGNKISPGNPVTKPDGTVIRTLRGELAWQLGGKKAFARVVADDEKATSLGDVLRELFNEYGPCLILIDEWVAYARQLHDRTDLPAGGFETQPGEIRGWPARCASHLPGLGANGGYCLAGTGGPPRQALGCMMPGGSRRRCSATR